MDVPTRNLSDYVKATEQNLSQISRVTRIPYTSLYNSRLNNSRNRSLRVGEYMKICEFLKVDPKYFV